MSLDEVVQRFADSEQALSQAKEKLDALAAAETTQAAVASGLQEVSTALKDFVTTASALVAQAGETQRTAREVLQAGESLIDGTDIKELQGSLARIETLIDEVSQRDTRIAELEAQLAERTAVLTGRQKKRLGLL